jgi:hypothetical protein
VQKSAESTPSLDLPTRGRRQRQLGRRWRTSAERPVRALAVVVLDEDAQDPVELAQSGNQQPVEALRPHGADEALGICVRLGARGGVRITLMPSPRKTSSKLATNFAR